MKKTIQKPENWQDFESLCKNLWGEIWSIPMKIKKNGRNGQPQAGVDIYGLPKGEMNYWGIQCKGKDEYVNAKLTKKDIDTEIEKAKTFKPKLAVFVFATSMNKNSDIEEYVRIKDLESRKNGQFEILLYCWEDIADLIDENRDTFNYYVSNQQHKTKYDFTVQLNEFQSEYVIHPKCVRRIKKYRLKEEELLSNLAWLKSMNRVQTKTLLSVSKSRINEAICSFEIIMSNTGSVVIEDWRVIFDFIGEHKEILDQLGTGPMGMIDITVMKYKRTFIDGNRISYSPRNNEPLIQKDNRCFEAYIIPECKEYTIPIKWQLLARDFNSTGEIHLKVEPEFDDQIIYEEVETEDELKDDEIISVYAKKNYSDDDEQ